MIRRLRLRFILTNMLLVATVLVAVLCVAAASTYHQVITECDDALRGELMRGEGDNFKFMIGHGAGDKFNKQSLLPTFSVTLGDDLAVQQIRAERVDIANEDVASAAAQALATGENSGALTTPYVRFRREGRVIAFVSRQNERDTLTRFFVVALLIGALALGAFLLVSIFLSGLAVKPVERAWTQQRQFVADASHELKTPLTVMLANVSIMSAHPERTIADNAEWLKNTREEAVSMKGLVEDMLFLAKSDDARAPLALAPTNLSEAIWSEELLFEPVAFERGVSLESDIEPDICVKGDVSQLKRAVAVLLDNAIKYAGHAGGARVTLAARQGRARLTVANTGEPIAPDKLAHVFERFYRADDSRVRAQGGYGLGLAIAKGIVEAHGGRISVASDAENGTVFSIMLPLCAK